MRVRSAGSRLLLAGALALAVGGAVGAQRGILEDPSRPESERERDPGSRPLEVYGWIGIGQGMVVADLMPFGGYNSHLLARVVGDEGRVLAAWAFSDGAVQKLGERFSEAHLDNVESMRDVSAVADDSIDVWLTVRNLHDLFIPQIGEQFGFDGLTVLAEMMRTLRPGGLLGVVAARTPEEGLNDKTHRLNQEYAVRLLQEAGFEFLESSELLAVEGDDYTAMGFPTRYNVDRFLLKFRKPVG